MAKRRGGGIFKRLKKWQPGKTLKKVAQFVPGGSAIADQVEAGLDAFKRRRSEGQSPGDAFASTMGVQSQTTQQAVMKDTTKYLIFGGIALVIILMMRKR